MVAVPWALVACIGLAGCVAADDPGGVVHVGGTEVEEERVECPVRCIRHGNLVSCKADCPPTITEKRLR